MFPLYDENRSRRKPYVNWLLIVLNVVVFIWELQKGLSIEIAMKYGEVPYTIMKGENLHTLITSMFLHGSIIHLASNMYYLLIFGDNVEDKFGHSKYLVLYLLFGVLSGIAHSAITVLYEPWGALIPAIGASGAVSGVLGAYLVFFPKARIICLTFYFFIRLITIPAIVFIGLWFLIQILMSGSQTGVAYWAHIGGFIAGFVVAVAFRVYRSLKKSRYYDVWSESYYV